VYGNAPPYSDKGCKLNQAVTCLPPLLLNVSFISSAPHIMLTHEARYLTVGKALVIKLFRVVSLETEI